MEATGQSQAPACGPSGKNPEAGGLPGRAEFETPGLGPLWTAALLDAALGLSFWALCASCLLRAKDLPGNLLALPRDVLPGLLVFAVLLHLVYHVLAVGGFGQTLGKRAMRIAVIRRDGFAAGYGRALLRSVGGMLTVLTLGLANLGVLLRRDRRGAGDWLAGTRVIRIPRP